MPLSHSKSKAAFSHNVAAEVNAGKPVKQAVAIAFSEKRRNMAEGGTVEDQDHEALLNHVALECMEAIEKKDVPMFIDSFHTLVADCCMKMGMDDDDSEQEDEGEST